MRNEYETYFSTTLFFFFFFFFISYFVALFSANKQIIYRWFAFVLSVRVYAFFHFSLSLLLCAVSFVSPKKFVSIKFMRWTERKTTAWQSRRFVLVLLSLRCGRVDIEFRMNLFVVAGEFARNKLFVCERLANDQMRWATDVDTGRRWYTNDVRIIFCERECDCVCVLIYGRCEQRWLTNVRPHHWNCTRITINEEREDRVIKRRSTHRQANDRTSDEFFSLSLHASDRLEREWISVWNTMQPFSRSRKRIIYWAYIVMKLDRRHRPAHLFCR